MSRYKVVKLLIKTNSLTKLMETSIKTTPLMWAAAQKDLYMIRILLEKGKV